jgi:hypothetical protein
MALRYKLQRCHNCVIGHSPLIQRSRASGVSKDEADIGTSWFEMARSRLLTMRVLMQ